MLFYESFIYSEYLSRPSKDVPCLYKYLKNRKILSSINVKSIVQFENLNHDCLSIMNMNMSSVDSTNNNSNALFTKKVKDLA